MAGLLTEKNGAKYTKTSLKMTLIFSILFCVIFVTFVTSVWVKYGVQKSVSMSFYALNNPFSFVLFCWGISVTYLLISPTLLSFLAATGVIFVGGHPFVKRDFIRQIHLIVAIAGISFAYLSLIFDYQNYIIPGIFGIISVLIYLLDFKNKIWWIEIAAFIGIAINNFLIR
jgi:hypothetical protein